jgi:alkylhydroperoxidase family enzyme
LSELPADEQEVARYARQLVLSNRVEQSVFDTLQTKYGTKWLVELTAIISFYGALSGVVNAFEVPVPDADGDRF